MHRLLEERFWETDWDDHGQVEAYNDYARELVRKLREGVDDED